MSNQLIDWLTESIDQLIDELIDIWHLFWHSKSVFAANASM
jgi:hypothetical protein